MTDLRTERATEVRGPEPAPAPDLRDRDERPPGGPATVLPQGVELARLLALVRLTAPQALEVGVGLLAAADGREHPDTAGRDGDPVEAVVTADGEVLLRPRTGAGPPAAGRTAADLAAVLADVAGAARLRGRPADPAAEELLARLDRAATDLPDAGVPAVARVLQEAVAGTDRTVARAELGALVRAVGARTAAPGGTGPAGSPSAVVRATPAGRAGPRGTGTAVRRAGAWLLSVLVLAAVVLLEVAVLRDDIAADVDLLLDAGRSGAASSTAPEPDGLPVVPPAPAAAGDVTGVDLRPLERCAPATACTLRLQVRLDAGPERTVTWSYRVVDRCTGAATTVPGGTVTVPPGGRQVTAVGTVALPDLPAVAVLAVTGLPAAAASPPVSAGSCPPDRPTG
ncbi:hypothetical protein [Geodermatophilus sp. URMC 62]|uniref:hypothetical protein n=1 Tax=Geodermatophilus sp. URMC 62 TaxID=3423414 RepID=UPI00406D035C